jgi:eukaryotic-like serine/threonine-protein kinase
LQALECEKQNMISQTLSHYRILERIGQGGMGEVYRAEDTNLSRQVAIKVLPDEFAHDAERLARFQREAQVLASLSHPNITTLYGLEESDGKRFIVMELVEGHTLAQRLLKGPMPVEEALEVCRQIAEGLEYAHEHGIIHRDLKPANIKLRPDGAVKILDFGLARALLPDAAAADVSHSPTITAAATRAGVILGTAAYMSPEQARGKTLDQRTDIWALGCVLYEMLTGRQAFQGDTISDTLAAVLRAEPAWGALPPGAGARVQDLLRRCLAKDPKQRLHAVADARLEIQAITSEPAGPAVASRADLARRPMAWRPLIAAGVVGSVLAALIIAGLLLLGVWPRESRDRAQALRLSVIHTEGSEVGVPAISPDGRRIAYRARRADGMPMLWVRDLESFEARPLPGTDDGFSPFWSPDSRHLGFFAGGFLKRVPADGGPVQVVVPVSWQGPVSGTWAPDDTIVFSQQDMQLFRVSAASHASTAKAAPATTRQGKDWSHYWPSFLPDGRRFLFTAKLWTSSGEASVQGICIGSLDSPDKIQRLLPDLSSAFYTPPGYIVFARDGTLCAVSFDLKSERLTGEPKHLGAAVAIDGLFYLIGASASGNGTLAVRPPPACGLSYFPEGGCASELRLVDRTGKVMNTTAGGRYGACAAAPDGRRVAVQEIDPRAGTSDVWLADMQTGARTPLTMTRGYAGAPVWSPDGTRLAYAYQPPGQVDDVYVKDLRNGQVTAVIESPAEFEHPVAWSHDGKCLLVWVGGYTHFKGLGVWSFASRTLKPFVNSDPEERGAVFSPDDRHVAFSSIESGRREVYVTTFPERRQTWPLTTEGGRVLSWSNDGREILVATLSGHIAAYPVSTEGGFTSGQPTILIRDLGSAARLSSASPDHSRILIHVSPDATKDKGEIRLLFNWAEALKQLPLGPASH